MKYFLIDDNTNVKSFVDIEQALTHEVGETQFFTFLDNLVLNGVKFSIHGFKFLHRKYLIFYNETAHFVTGIITL